MKKEHWGFLIGYVVGSFFGITQLLSLFSGAAGKVQAG